MTFFSSETLPASGDAFIENEREERRLAGAVRADKPDAIAAIHLERDILEEDAPGERFADLRNGEHGTVERSPNPAPAPLQSTSFGSDRD